MHKNQSGLYTNNLSNHASLLLSASPTIINSPLQNNTNNSQQSSPQQPSSVAHVRRQPSTPLLATVGNLDNDVYMNIDSPPINKSSEGYINFKKPQNEIFRKLDGTIQKIVAAHSNLNKLYALNDFSTLGVGPKRPFELPPQLPPPPPWVPKVSADYCGQWNDEAIEPLLALDKTAKRGPTLSLDSDPNTAESRIARDATLSQNCLNTTKQVKTSSLIDSAISKLHQKHNIQRVLNTRGVAVYDPQFTESTNIQQPSPSASTKPTGTKLTPAQFELLVRNIRDTYEQMEHGDTNQKKGVQNTESHAQSKRTDFQNKRAGDIVDLLKKEIAAVTKSIGFNFSPVQKRSKQNDDKSLLLKSSPQTLYNTIRRETSLLLNRREPASNRSSLSLLSTEPLNRQNAHQNLYSNSNKCQPMTKLQQTIKVIVPPTEFHPLPKDEKKETSPSENEDRECTKSDHSNSKGSLSSKRPPLTYQVIRNKIRLFQEANKIYLGKGDSSPIKSSLIKKKFGHKTELDRIVDRLQAQGTPNNSSFDPKHLNNLRRKLVPSSTNFLNSPSAAASISAPTPIPVFRSPLSVSSKGGYVYACSSSATRIVNMKSKKTKRLHHFGLRLGNYMDKECPQPNSEKITVEQFARCLDLVRSNDVSLQIRQEKLTQAECKWRMPSGNRPLRLRRIRGERLHMPASSSYKATRRIGLQ